MGENRGESGGKSEGNRGKCNGGRKRREMKKAGGSEPKKRALQMNARASVKFQCQLQFKNRVLPGESPVFFFLPRFVWLFKCENSYIFTCMHAVGKAVVISLCARGSFVDGQSIDAMRAIVCDSSS